MNHFLLLEGEPRLYVMLSDDLLEKMNNVSECNKKNEHINEWIDDIDYALDHLSQTKISFDYANQAQRGNNIYYLNILGFDVYYSIKINWRYKRPYIFVVDMNLNLQKYNLLSIREDCVNEYVHHRICKIITESITQFLFENCINTRNRKCI